MYKVRARRGPDHHQGPRPPAARHPAHAAEPGNAVRFTHGKEARLTASPSPWRVFRARVRRDLHVVSRELPFFLLRTTLQPIMFTIVFGYLLPKMGFVQRGYTGALLPGVLAVSLAFASVQA